MIAAFLKRLWRRLNPRSDIALDGDLYMRRWRFMPEWLPGFRVHNLVRSDKDRELHDHPFDFISIILKGGYFEWTPTPDGGQVRKWYGPGSIVVRRAEDLHRIELPLKWEVATLAAKAGGGYKATSWRSTEEQQAWTFVIRSRHRREWGFMTPTGWVHWKKFVIAHNNTIIQHGSKREQANAQAFNDDEIPF